MPRVYKPDPLGKRYKQYDKNLIEEAIEYYRRSKQPLRVVAQKYNIHCSVLQRHCTRNVKPQGGQRVLSNEAEEHIIKCINKCAEWGYPLNPLDSRFLIKNYLEKLGRRVLRFRNNLPGPDFVKTFLDRHKDKISQINKRNRNTASRLSEEYDADVKRSAIKKSILEVLEEMRDAKLDETESERKRKLEVSSERSVDCGLYEDYLETELAVENISAAKIKITEDKNKDIELRYETNENEINKIGNVDENKKRKGKGKGKKTERRITKRKVIDETVIDKEEYSSNNTFIFTEFLDCEENNRGKKVVRKINKGKRKDKNQKRQVEGIYTSQSATLECCKCGKIVNANQVSNLSSINLDAKDGSLDWTCQKCQQESPTMKSPIITNENDSSDDDDEVNIPDSWTIATESLLKNIFKEVKKVIRREVTNLATSVDHCTKKVDELSKKLDALEARVQKIEQHKVSDKTEVIGVPVLNNDTNTYEYIWIQNGKVVEK